MIRPLNPQHDPIAQHKRRLSDRSSAIIKVSIMAGLAVTSVILALAYVELPSLSVAVVALLIYIWTLR